MLDTREIEPTMAAEVNGTSEDIMVGQERWEQIRRLRLEQGLSVSELARQFEVDRKTVRRCLRQEQWRAYEREPKVDTLLSPHEDFLRERVAQFLDAHERAFDHFGGHTREHLYDRPRTVCYANDEGRIVWNPTFKAFAQYWSFEPRVCRPYRAQTKGKVESGVKYLKRNFLPGREFIDIVHLSEQLAEWNDTIADQRNHGTTHEVPLVNAGHCSRRLGIKLARQPKQSG
jgi:transposase